MKEMLPLMQKESTKFLLGLDPNHPLRKSSVAGVVSGEASVHSPHKQMVTGVELTWLSAVGRYEWLTGQRFERKQPPHQTPSRCPASPYPPELDRRRLAAV